MVSVEKRGGGVGKCVGGCKKCGGGVGKCVGVRGEVMRGGGCGKMWRRCKEVCWSVWEREKRCRGLGGGEECMG